MLCERCGTENPEGVVVCVQCYYAVGIPYAAATRGGKKGSADLPPWAIEMGLTDPDFRRVNAQLSDALKGEVIAYWMPSKDDATETEKALNDTIGKEIQGKKIKVANLSIQGRTALFIAGKITDAENIRTTCEVFNGQAAFTPNAEPAPKGKKK